MPTSQHNADSRMATLIGMSAILMWSASVGLFRSVSEFFGATGGAALIFTTSALLATLASGWPRLRTLPKAYLLCGGALFAAYEISLALSIGMAHNRAQALELGMLNYLWPSLTVLLAVITRQQRGSWLLLPGLILSLVGIVWVMKGENPWSPALLWQHMTSNPPAYLLALAAAFIWAGYTVVTRLLSDGQPVIPLFLALTALLLWIKYVAGSEASLHINLAGMAQVLLLGCLTAAAYSCWNHGVKAGQIALIASASYFTPVLSMTLASLWLGVAPGKSFFLGVVMVTAGSLICWWSTRPRY